MYLAQVHGTLTRRDVPVLLNSAGYNYTKSYHRHNKLWSSNLFLKVCYIAKFLGVK